MRKRLYEIIEIAEQQDRVSAFYDAFMILLIVISLIPVGFKQPPTAITHLDKTVALLFAMDYLFRWITADYKLGKKALSFLKYPFTVMALIDLASILPSLIVVNSSLKLLKILRLFRSMRVLRVFKTFRYSKNIAMIIEVFRRKKESLVIVVGLALGYIVVSALLIFSVEPESFESFFDAFYWATISLTTVGYGDVYAVSTMGKVITMISSVLGIAIVALPASIITAGYMEMITGDKEEDKNE